MAKLLPCCALVLLTHAQAQDSIWCVW